jgi:lipopolysaccharide heptosyltransferase II
MARTGIRRLFAIFLGAAGTATARWRSSRASAIRPQRFLVIRLDLLGDVMFSLAGVRALREQFPNARIVMLTLPSTAPLARMSRLVDEVIAVDTNRIRRVRTAAAPRTWIDYRRTVQRLRSERFDIAIALSGPMASLWATLSGAQKTIGFGSEAYRGFLTHPVPGGRYDERSHEIEYVMRLMRATGVDLDTYRPPILDPGAEARTRIDTLLATNRVTSRDSFVVFHTGATNGSAKRWPPQHWAAVAHVLQMKYGVPVVLTGARSDSAIALEVRAGAPHAIDLVGKTSIAELVALLERAAVVVSGDSGPLHVAVALARPLVCVYGPTDPYIYGPFQPVAPVALHRMDLTCSPCYSMATAAECPLGDPVCMRFLPPAPVVRSILSLLRSTQLPSPLRTPIFDDGAKYFAESQEKPES